MTKKEPKIPESPTLRIMRFWFPVILYSGIIFYASSIPSAMAAAPGFVFDKILHVIEYYPFGFLVARAIYETNRSINIKGLIIISIVVSFIYGFTDEFHQLFVAGRNARVADIIADVIGGTLGGFTFARMLGKS